LEDAGGVVMSKKKQQEFCVYAKSKEIVSVTITAENLDAAVAKAKEMKEHDFVEVLGECIDGSFELLGVQNTDWD
jgi:hypothetical protein